MNVFIRLESIDFLFFRILGKQPGRFRQMSDEEDEDEDETSKVNLSSFLCLGVFFVFFVQSKRRDQFVENPEVVRERFAQQRAARFQRQNPQPVVDRDVAGTARGRGQTTTVTHNRRWKDTHKASQGNHNRRDRAAQKANRGLLS